MRLHTLFALFFLMTASSVNAQVSLDGTKERASNAGKTVGETTGNAVRAVGAAAGKVTDAAMETVESSKSDLKEEATPEATRAKLDAMADMTLARLFADRPDSRELFEQSVGYAVFDTREASFYVVAGYGRGVAVDRRDDSHTYMKMAKTGAGLSFGLGGFDSQLVILYQDGGKFAEFLSKGLDASAQVGTMAGKKKDELALQFNEGRAVFVLTKEGWKIAATLTGSRYWPDDELN